MIIGLKGLGGGDWWVFNRLVVFVFPVKRMLPKVSFRPNHTYRDHHPTTLTLTRERERGREIDRQRRRPPPNHPYLNERKRDTERERGEGMVGWC